MARIGSFPSSGAGFASSDTGWRSVSNHALEHRVNRLENDVMSIYEMLTDIKATQKRHDLNFATLATQIDELDERFDELGGRADVLDGKMGLLDGKVNVLDEKVGALDGRVGALDGKVGALDGKVNILDSKVDEILSLLKSGARGH